MGEVKTQKYSTYMIIWIGDAHCFDHALLVKLPFNFGRSVKFEKLVQRREGQRLGGLHLQSLLNFIGIKLNNNLHHTPHNVTRTRQSKYTKQQWS